MRNYKRQNYFKLPNAGSWKSGSSRPSKFMVVSQKVEEELSVGDFVSLQLFMNYINDPSLLTNLMVEQGLTGVDYVEPIRPIFGGSADNNYKGKIHWSDGT